MRKLISKIAALVVALTVVMTARANEVTDVSMEHQLTCLAQNIYHEAGSESVQGKVAVAQVTINRANSGKFPSTICGVVHQKTAVAGKFICQFSWKCSNNVGTINQVMYAESMMIARWVLLEYYRIPEVNDALFFHSDRVNPHWPLERVARIGNHVFYSDDKVIRKVAYNK